MTIDWWTLGLQTINVAVLVWLLQRFFWRPVAAMIEQRRATAQKTLADAQAKQDQAAAALAEIEKTRAGFAREREAILSAAHDAADQARTARLDEAAKEAAALQAAAKAAIADERAAADKAWTDRANRLAVDVAQRLAARLDGAAVRAAFLDWLLNTIRALPEPQRLAVAANGAALEAVSAALLEPGDQDRYRALIGEALGARPQIAFRADPALIAGLELHAPHWAVSNSWRADLGQILTDLAHDQHS
jgi:F-type H+-transporting ATPase subunit b